VRDALGHQPGHHLDQRLVIGAELAHLLPALPGSLTRRPHHHRDDLFTHINRGHPLVHDLHYGLPPDCQQVRHPRNPHEHQESETRARTGNNPEYPTGTGSSVIFETGSPRTRTTRHQRATRTKFQRPASAAPAASESLRCLVSCVRSWVVVSWLSSAAWFMRCSIVSRSVCGTCMWV
jgi:hypothetical protein